MTAMIAAGVAGLGAFGSVARAAVQGVAARRERLPFFWGTLIVNLSGAFALGVLHGTGSHGTPLKLLGAALLGAFTTFSGWMLETLRLRDESLSLAASYLLGSLVLGLLAVWAGHGLGQLI